MYQARETRDILSSNVVSASACVRGGHADQAEPQEMWRSAVASLNAQLQLLPGSKKPDGPRKFKMNAHAPRDVLARAVAVVEDPNGEGTCTKLVRLVFSTSGGLLQLATVRRQPSKSRCVGRS